MTAGRGRPVSAVVLVEGVSDLVAVETLARRRGRDLAGEGVRVVAMGGATNVARFVEELGPQGRGLRLAGMCDVNEVRYVRRALERAGYAADLSHADLETHSFFVCAADLEDELIRALGPAAVERIFAEQGDLAAYRTFQNQPAQRERPDAARLRRFMGTQSGRKIRYARVLVDGLDLDGVPRPLDRLLGSVP